MAKIRKDLVGTVLAFDEHGNSTLLAAGDKVPDGFNVGDHVLAAKGEDNGSTQSDPATPAVPAPAGTALVVPPMIGKGSSTADWRAYAAAAATERGLQIDFGDDAKRGDIVAALEAAGIPVTAD